jgi:hypothetical protein
MSEYQYYEFLAVDRPLDERQLDLDRVLARMRGGVRGHVRQLPDRPT